MIVSLDQLKSHLGITSSSEDTLLAFYLNAISSFLPAKIGRAIELTDFVEYIDGDDIKDTIFLANYPVTELTSLKYRSGPFSDPVWNDFSSDDYLLSVDDGTIQVQVSYSGLNNIKATYKAGSASNAIPYALQLAAIKLAAKAYNKRSSDGFSSEEVAGARVDWDTFLSKDIEELINPFRKMKI